MPLSNAQSQSPAHKPTHAPYPQNTGWRMSSNEDSPGMDFVGQMVRGHEDNINAAVTWSIVVWAGAESPQNIEGGEGTAAAMLTRSPRL